ncbi:unnamed protein product [Rangifer tarandus platyrhynchus]|uniref:Uncharacterized protein n=1 Tax=Rangifer tarandus platyrhynchus TaxID=3082113 RepID=A0AC59Z2V2_RANTA
MSGKQEKQEASAGVGGSPDGKKWRDTVGGGDSRVFCVRPAANGPFRGLREEEGRSDDGLRSSRSSQPSALRGAAGARRASLLHAAVSTPQPSGLIPLLLPPPPVPNSGPLSRSLPDSNHLQMLLRAPSAFHEGVPVLLLKERRVYRSSVTEIDSATI